MRTWLPGDAPVAALGEPLAAATIEAVRPLIHPAFLDSSGLGTSVCGASGRSMSMASPPISLRRASTVPPIDSIRPRTTARPMPVPERELGRFSGTR